jgi:cytochrome subunit of sulfide dehydrogenase
VKDQQEPTAVNTLKVRPLLVACAGLALSFAAAAQTAPPAPAPAAVAPAAAPLPPNPQRDAMFIRSLAATCANCHGTNGKAVEGSSVVTLAGMPREYIVAQMKAFKDGTRPATIMHQLSKGYTDDQINKIAVYFSEQKK